MRIAIPIADGRVSPLFDVAGRLLLVNVEGGKEIGRTEEILRESELGPRARRVGELHADVLICGAISRPLESLLAAGGLEVVPQTCGPVDQVLQAFVDGQLTGDAFVMPGCCGRRRRLRAGYGRHSSRKRGNNS